jgi:hypothetical protein
MRDGKKKPLYRKINTRARGVHHYHGGDFRNHRSSKNADLISMRSGIRRGLDYTPLFRFLISRVGAVRTEVHSEAVSRLDKPDPIYWLVSLSQDQVRAVVRIGESSYFSGLYVDADGRLQVVAPEIGPETLEPTCSCCTHTFNGIPFTKKYQG